MIKQAFSLLSDHPRAPHLPSFAGLPETWHVFTDDEVNAVDLALLSGRPLLIRGEPGTGKSQLARAAAQHLGRAFVWQTVDAQTEPSELLYQVDPVARLAKAQVLGAAGERDVKAALDLARFLVPGRLWWAFDWVSAAEVAKRVTDAGEVRVTRPHESQDALAKQGVVLLIDEVDKADRAVPNGLLEALGQRQFQVPGSSEPVMMTGAGRQQDAAGPPPPLVVVTTNEERALPDAFLRRCAVLQISLPVEQENFVGYLVERGQQHFAALDAADETLLADAAGLVFVDRGKVQALGLVPPGLAEYLDLLRAMDEFRQRGRKREQLRKLMKDMKTFVLEKHPRAEGGGLPR